MIWSFSKAWILIWFIRYLFGIYRERSFEIGVEDIGNCRVLILSSLVLRGSFGLRWELRKVN